MAPVELKEYENLLIKANTSESKNKSLCMDVLNSCLQIINRDPTAFISKFPNRKYDAIVISKRIGSVAQKMEKEKATGVDVEAIKAKEKLLDSIRVQMEKADALSKKNEYSGALQNLNNALKIAEDNKLDDQIPLIESMIFEINNKTQDLSQKEAALEKLIKEAEVEREQQKFVLVISDYQQIIKLATVLNKTEIKTQYEQALKETQDKYDKLEKLKLDIKALRVEAFDMLEKGWLAKSTGKYEKICEKIENYSK